jgi:hypothetical protein
VIAYEHNGNVLLECNEDGRHTMTNPAPFQIPTMFVPPNCNIQILQQYGRMRDTSRNRQRAGKMATNIVIGSDGAETVTAVVIVYYPLNYFLPLRQIL